MNRISVRRMTSQPELNQIGASADKREASVWPKGGNQTNLCKLVTFYVVDLLLSNCCLPCCISNMDFMNLILMLERY